MAIRDNLKTGGSSKKLYEALQYSGLVTEDMSFDEICEVLANEYPEYTGLLLGENFMETRVSGGFEMGSTCSLSLEGNYYKFARDGAAATSFAHNANQLDLSKHSKLTMKYNSLSGYNIVLFASETKVTNHNDADVKSSSATSSGTITVDLSDYNKNAYIGMTIYGGNTASFVIEELKLS